MRTISRAGFKKSPAPASNFLQHRLQNISGADIKTISVQALYLLKHRQHFLRETFSDSHNVIQE